MVYSRGPGVGLYLDRWLAITLIVVTIVVCLGGWYISTYHLNHCPIVGYTDCSMYGCVPVLNCPPNYKLWK